MAFAAALVAFSDTMATSRGFASRNHYRIDANQEMLALGLGNITAGLTQGLPVSSSGSRTAAADPLAAGPNDVDHRRGSGGLRDALSDGFVVFASQCRLGRYLDRRRLEPMRFPRISADVAISRSGNCGGALTMAGVVSIGVLEGIGIGVLFSIILVVKALAFPDDAVLGQAGPEKFHGIKRHPEAKAIPGVIIYRFSGPLFFANCEFFRNRAEELIETSPEPLHCFILDASRHF